MERLLQDLKYSLRMLRQQRAFAFAAIAALALGIGATTAVFSVVNAVLLRPFPYPDPDRIVFFMNASRQGSGPGASPAKFEHWAAQTDVVQDASAFRNVTLNFTGGETPEQIVSGNVSENFFRLWGGKTILGRTFSTEEDRPNGPKAAVLSYGWWTRRFASDPNIVGKTILLSGEPFVVIGVIGKDFDASEFIDNPAVWTAFRIDPNTGRPGTLLPGGGATEAEHHPRAGAGTKLKQSAEVYPRQISECPRREGVVQRRAGRDGVRAQLEDSAHHSARRGGRSSSHRLRQRRQPAARALDRAQAGDGDSCGHGRRSRAHHPAIDHGERVTLGHRRNARPHPRLGRHSCAALDQHSGTSARRREWRSRVARLAIGGVHGGRVSRARVSSSA